MMQIPLRPAGFGNSPGRKTEGDTGSPGNKGFRQGTRGTTGKENMVLDSFALRNTNIPSSPTTPFSPLDATDAYIRLPPQ